MGRRVISGQTVPHDAAKIQTNLMIPTFDISNFGVTNVGLTNLINSAGKAIRCASLFLKVFCDRFVDIQTIFSGRGYGGGSFCFSSGQRYIGFC